ncbi:hypothetical protein [Mitsuaria sp. GD03876]|uniref:hypothetical protein n=1 Tax=Mitsuaria sp. GD03876 TaxID=2975399 RepID=UPI00244BE853|nr:hypothetical protein [Mitsuaria sp. GD03876]MDH0864498.1 hypothetical protein [Mitsuaria sp. GD03876]
MVRIMPPARFPALPAPFPALLLHCTKSACNRPRRSYTAFMLHCNKGAATALSLPRIPWLTSFLKEISHADR